MRLAELVETSRQVSGTSGRLEKVHRLSALLRRVPPHEIEVVIAFLSGAPRQGRIGVGYAAVEDALPGAAAIAPSLELRDVDARFGQIAQVSGKGSALDKVRLLRDLLARATAPEQHFLVRLMLGELRQGALEGLMVEAVAQSGGLPSDKVRRALMTAGDLATVARVALTEGERGLARFAVQLLRPVQPMLAQTADDADDALDRLGVAGLEYKLDGARIQIHKSGDEVRVFSRRLRDVTSAVPEVVELARLLPAREAIMDGEAIALTAGGAPQPFQITMRRFGRKLDVARLRAELPLTPFLFDLLYLDGIVLLDEAQARRFAMLAEFLPAAHLVARTVTGDREAARAFLAEALARGHEGVMAKSLEAGYEAGGRGHAWLKVKPAHTLDLVVLAAEWGHGRRSGWLSNLHLGARDPARGEFVMLGKTFKGMTDEMLAWQTERLLALEVARDDYTVYVRPELVVEVAFNDIQESPHYVGGLALRFARVKRYRPDKSAREADTFDVVQALYRRHRWRPRG